MTDAISAWVQEVLDVHVPAGTLPVNDRKASRGQRVSRVECGAGQGWILKQVGLAHEWEAERNAYEHWSSVLDGHVPTLLASDENLRTLLLSEVPGAHPKVTHGRAYRRAGVLLGRLHGAAHPQDRTSADRDHAAQRLERLLVESREVLNGQEQAFVRAQGERLAELPLGHKVPCHGDYRPHNWLLDTSGTLRVIDFGKARWDQPAWDLTKLFFRPWWRRPRLARAFLEGYGRELRAEEVEYLQSKMAVDALSHAAFGVKRDSDRHVTFARARLSDLMAGHQVLPASLSLLA